MAKYCAYRIETLFATTDLYRKPASKRLYRFHFLLQSAMHARATTILPVLSCKPALSLIALLFSLSRFIIPYILPSSRTRQLFETYSIHQFLCRYCKGLWVTIPSVPTHTQVVTILCRSCYLRLYQVEVSTSYLTISRQSPYYDCSVFLASFILYLYLSSPSFCIAKNTSNTMVDIEHACEDVCAMHNLFM